MINIIIVITNIIIIISINIIVVLNIQNKTIIIIFFCTPFT